MTDFVVKPQLDENPLGEGAKKDFAPASKQVPKIGASQNLDEIPEQKANEGGFLVNPAGVPKEQDSAENAAEKFNKRDKVRVQSRAQAYDPYSRENFYISAHSMGVVVPSLDPRGVLKNNVTIMLTSPDNGSGRIVQIEARHLVKQS